MPWTDIPKTAVTLSPYLGTGQVTIDDIKLLRYTVVSADVMTLAFRIHGSFDGGRLNGVLMELAIPYRGVYVASAGDNLTTTPPEGGLTFTNWCAIADPHSSCRRRPWRHQLGEDPDVVDGRDHVPGREETGSSEAPGRALTSGADGRIDHLSSLRRVAGRPAVASTPKSGLPRVRGLQPEACKRSYSGNLIRLRSSLNRGSD
jgi:hypothetical protein